MKIIFAGTPDFAAAALSALLASAHEVSLVLTQPDRPAGRGMKLRPSAVKRCAQQAGLPLAQPASLRRDDPAAVQTAALRGQLESMAPDAMVVAAYGLILPQWLLELPRLGCLNIHASLLPRWRGAAPIQRAILAGDSQTGITIMQMDAGLDTGDILLQHALPITPEDTAGSLHDRLARCGAEQILQALDARAQGQLVARPQPGEGSSYAQKISKAEAQINWSGDAHAIARQIRAFNPFPGAHTELDGKLLKLWAARPQDHEAGGPAPQPGQVTRTEQGTITVACGQGQLVVEQLQLAGGRRLDSAAFLAGRVLPPSTRLGPSQADGPQ